MQSLKRVIYMINSLVINQNVSFEPYIHIVKTTVD